MFKFFKKSNPTKYYAIAYRYDGETEIRVDVVDERTLTCMYTDWACEILSEKEISR